MKLTTGRRASLAVLYAASLTLATVAVPSVASAQPAGRVDLVWLKNECLRTSLTDADGVGKVDLTSELRDENTRIVIAPPCLVRLGSNATVTLNNVQIRSRTLMFRDLYFPTGETRIKFQRSTFTGDTTAGFMIDLYDRGDQVDIEASTLDYPSGVVIRAHGNRAADLGEATRHYWFVAFLLDAQYRVMTKRPDSKRRRNLPLHSSCFHGPQINPLLSNERRANLRQRRLPQAVSWPSVLSRNQLMWSSPRWKPKGGRFVSRLRHGVFLAGRCER